MVSTHLKYCSQNGNLPQVGAKKKCLKPPTRYSTCKSTKFWGVLRCASSVLRISLAVPTLPLTAVILSNFFTPCLGNFSLNFLMMPSKMPTIIKLLLSKRGWILLNFKWRELRGHFSWEIFQTWKDTKIPLKFSFGGSAYIKAWRFPSTTFKRHRSRRWHLHIAIFMASQPTPPPEIRPYQGSKITNIRKNKRSTRNSITLFNHLKHQLSLYRHPFPNHPIQFYSIRISKRTAKSSSAAMLLLCAI